MSDVVIVAILSLAGSLFGSIAGIMTSNKIIVYKVEQLEKKVDELSNSQSEVYELKQSVAVIKTMVEYLKKRVED